MTLTYPMALTLIEEMMHISIARGNRDTSSIEQVITEFSQMIEIEPSIKLTIDQPQPNEIIKDYYVENHICITCSGITLHTSFYNNNALARCICFNDDFETNPY